VNYRRRGPFSLPCRPRVAAGRQTLDPAALSSLLRPPLPLPPWGVAGRSPGGAGGGGDSSFPCAVGWTRRRASGLGHEFASRAIAAALGLGLWRRRDGRRGGGARLGGRRPSGRASPGDAGCGRRRPPVARWWWGTAACGRRWFCGGAASGTTLAEAVRLQGWRRRP
jgi:hypothetical protein